MLIALGVLLTTVAVGCITRTGNYAVEIFTEMHYQPSYRSQEVPRLLPPEGSVPITGKEIAYDFDEYEGLNVPDTVVGEYNPGKASALFAVNCTVCHGAAGKGDGPMREFLMPKGFPPADLTGANVQGSTEGEVFGFLSHGGRTGFGFAQLGRKSPSPMPTFNKLLTEEDRWTLVIYVLQELEGP